MALAHDGLTRKRLHEWRWNGRKWLALGTLGSHRAVHSLAQHTGESAEVDVAVSEEDGAVGTVMLAREAERIGGGEAPHPVGIAQDVVAHGMPGEDQVLKLVVDELGGTVVITLYLVTDNLHLLVYLVLGIDRMENHVGEQVHRPRKMVVHHGGIEESVFLIGKCVEVSAHALKSIDDVARLAPLSALKGDVLAEMGDSFVIFGFVARACSHAISAENYP